MTFSFGIQHKQQRADPIGVIQNLVGLAPGAPFPAGEIPAVGVKLEKVGNTLVVNEHSTHIKQRIRYNLGTRPKCVFKGPTIVESAALALPHTILAYAADALQVHRVVDVHLNLPRTIVPQRPRRLGNSVGDPIYAVQAVVSDVEGIAVQAAIGFPRIDDVSSPVSLNGHFSWAAAESTKPDWRRHLAFCPPAAGVVRVDYPVPIKGYGVEVHVPGDVNVPKIVEAHVK